MSSTIKRTSLAVIIAAFALTASSGAAFAAVIQGEIWQNVPASGADASIVPSGAPDATFTTSAINYDSRVTRYTPATFLNNPTFSNESAGFNPNASFNNSFIQLTGQTFLNAGANSFVVPHDDGLVLKMGGGIGTVVNVPGPTAPVDTPFTVNAPTAGLYDFTLQYGECCGAPAVLGFEVNGAPVGGVPGIPDTGSTFNFMSLAMAGLGVLRFRARKA